MNRMINEYAGRDCVAHGKIVTFSMPMEPYPDQRIRTIRVWLPDCYDGKRRFPVLYMHDAQNLFDGYDDQDKWYVNREMEALEQDGLPVIVVGVDHSPMRFSELCPDIPTDSSAYARFGLPEAFAPTGDLYAAFIAGPLKAFVDETFMTLPNAKHTAIGGSSMGGLMSLYMILKYPDIFSKAMVFSPNFIIHPKHAVLSRLASYDFSKLKDSRIFIFHGGLDLEALNWPFVRTVFEAMRERGMDEAHLALLYDSRQPHYESAWQKYFTEAFRYLFAE